MMMMIVFLFYSEITEHEKQKVTHVKLIQNITINFTVYFDRNN